MLNISCSWHHVCVATPAP